MRIGLLRHFPVDEGLPTGWKTASDLSDWHKRYDAAKALVGDADLGAGGWQVCLSSDLPRAQVTAQTLFPGHIEVTDLLREPNVAPFQTGKLRLPVWGWKMLLMASWMTGHRSQRASRDDFRRRVLAAADRICDLDADALVVSHAWMMGQLSHELRRRGFTGPKLRIPQHATVYTYEK